MMRIAVPAALFIHLVSHSAWAITLTAERFEGMGDNWSFDGGFFFLADGFAGEIDEGNLQNVLIDYQLRFTSPAGSYRLTGSDSIARLIGPSTNLMFDGHDLTLQPAESLPNKFSIQRVLDAGQSIVFNGQASFGPGNTLTLADDNLLFAGEVSSTRKLRGPLLIASVPEPSVMSLSILALLSTGVMRPRRHRA